MTFWTLTAGSLVAGLVLSAAGARLLGRAHQRRDIARRCLAARAEVIAVGSTVMPAERPDGTGTAGTSVRYRDRAGGVHESVLAAVRSGERYAVGEEIDVLYDPQDPSLVLHRDLDAAGARDLAGILYVVTGVAIAALAALAAVITVLVR